MNDKKLEEALNARAGGQCELCGATEALRAVPVDDDADEAALHVLLCGQCAPQVVGEVPLEDDKRWMCLQAAAWSEHAAVQVVSWRLLHRLGEVAWARELLEQLYLDEVTLAWAQAGLPDPAPEPGAITRDSNGNPLAEGDAVTLIRDLEVKGAGFTAKQGTLVKNIRLTDDPGLIEGKVNGTVIVLKTQYLKRA